MSAPPPRQRADGLLLRSDILLDGISPADPMITFCNDTYTVSHDRRHER